MQFDYRGIGIEVDHTGSFGGQVEDVKFSAPTLEEAKRKVDSLKTSGKKREVALPVLLLHSYGEASEITKATITGINRTSRDFTFKEQKQLRVNHYRISHIQPDTPAAHARLQAVIDARAATDRAEKASMRFALVAPAGHGAYETHLKALESDYAKKKGAE